MVIMMFGVEREMMIMVKVKLSVMAVYMKRWFNSYKDGNCHIKARLTCATPGCKAG